MVWKILPLLEATSRFTDWSMKHWTIYDKNKNIIFAMDLLIHITHGVDILGEYIMGSMKNVTALMHQVMSCMQPTD